MKKAELANSVDLDKVAQNEPPHLDLHYLPSSLWILMRYTLDLTFFFFFFFFFFLIAGEKLVGCLWAVKELSIVLIIAFLLLKNLSSHFQKKTISKV